MRKGAMSVRRLLFYGSDCFVQVAKPGMRLYALGRATSTCQLQHGLVRRSSVRTIRLSGDPCRGNGPGEGGRDVGSQVEEEESGAF